MAKNTKKRTIIYSNVKENKKLAEERKKNNENKIDLDDEIIIGFNTNKKNQSKQPATKKLQNKPKKQVNSAVNPQSKINILRIIKLLVIIAIVVGIVIFALKAPIFNIKEISVKVQNNTVLTEPQIKEISQINLEQNIFTISKRNAADNIKANSFVESVKIKRAIPNKIKIEVIERTVKFQLEKNNQYIDVDKYGVVVSQSNEKKDGIIISGAKTEEFKDGQIIDNEDLQALSDVLIIFQEAETNEIYESISKVDISDHNEYLIYFDALGKMAHIGNISSINDKMARVAKILERESNYEGEVFVNVDFNNKEYPYFREKV